MECAGVTISAWNATATGRDGIRAGGTQRVAAHNYGATTIEASRAEEEASCGAATGVTEWGGAGATVACHAAAAGRDAAPAGCSTGGREQGRGGATIAAMWALHVYHECIFVE